MKRLAVTVVALVWAAVMLAGTLMIA